jgi:hypothetical protein
MGGVAAAGVMLKSIGDYQREQDLRKQADETHREQLRSSTMHNNEAAKGVQDSDRQRGWDQQDRETAAAHMRALRPDAYQGDGGPTPVPAAPPAALPPPNPVPATALAGQTLQSDQPKELDPPPKAAEPPKPTANTTGGRMGLYDVLARKAGERGDPAGQQKYITARDQLEKEGFGKAARVALGDPGNVAAIEQVFNASGAVKIVPGSLVANMVEGKPNGTYNATMIDANGQQRQVQNYNIMNAAVALGVIAPPKTIHFKGDENVYTQDAGGNVKQIQEAGGRHKTITNTQGDVITTDEKTGAVTVTNPSGDTQRLTPEQAKAIPEINKLSTAEAKNRTDSLIQPGQPGYKPPLEAAKVAGIAQSIFVNNPSQRKDGLNGPVAVEIATAIHDKNPAAVTGTQRKENGELWTVVKYKGITYGLSRVPGQPGAPAAPTTAPAAPTPKPAAPAKPPLAQYDVNGPRGTTTPPVTPALPTPPKPAAPPPVFGGGAPAGVSPSTALSPDATKAAQDAYDKDTTDRSEKRFLDKERYKFTPSRGYSKANSQPPKETVDRALALEKAKPGTFTKDQVAYYNQMADFYKQK